MKLLKPIHTSNKLMQSNNSNLLRFHSKFATSVNKAFTWPVFATWISPGWRAECWKGISNNERQIMSGSNGHVREIADTNQ